MVRKLIVEIIKIEKLSFSAYSELFLAKDRVPTERFAPIRLILGSLIPDSVLREGGTM